LSERAAEADARARQAAGSGRMSLVLGGLQRRVGSPQRWMLAAPRGIALSQPFLDPRVICFGLGLQERFRPEPDQVKPVLAAAMEGSLPEAIRLRRDKRSFNEIHYLGLGRNATGLRRLVEVAPIDDLGIFDREALLRSIDEAVFGNVDPRGLYRLDTALAAIAWLSVQAKWHNRPIEGRHTVDTTSIRQEPSASQPSP
jgi:hypothetical protein